MFGPGSKMTLLCFTAKGPRESLLDVAATWFAYISERGSSSSAVKLKCFPSSVVFSVL